MAENNKIVDTIKAASAPVLWAVIVTFSLKMWGYGDTIVDELHEIKLIVKEQSVRQEFIEKDIADIRRVQEEYGHRLVALETKHLLAD